MCKSNHLTVRRITAFAELGKFLREFCLKMKSWEPSFPDSHDQVLLEAMRLSHQHNPWFIQEFVLQALQAIGEELTEEKLRHFMESYHYNIDAGKKPVRVGVIMAGNIPLVGFYDFLCVILSGHYLVAKVSGDDRFLLPALAHVLEVYLPELPDFMEFSNKGLKDIDAVIATGSNNSFRYFDYYFGHLPGVLRKNRSSLAVLTKEDFAVLRDPSAQPDALSGLADDLFLYFGLGCRNVSKILIPEGEDIRLLFPLFESYGFLFNHHKYRNNYEYYKSIYMLNQVDFLDTGFALFLKEPEILTTPVSVILYTSYSSLDTVNEWIRFKEDEIQCVVSTSAQIPGAVQPGKSQFPGLNDFADGVDVMKILTELK